MAPNVCRKTLEDPFLEVTPKKVFTIFVGENLQAKFVQKHFGQVWGNSGTNPSQTHKFAYSLRLCPDTPSTGHGMEHIC